MSVRDAYIAIRAWRRRPALAAIAITTIAIGIGAATSIYSVVDGVLLRPLPLPEASRIAAIWQTFPQWRKNDVLAPMWDRISLSQPEFRDLVRLQRSFTRIGIWSGGRALLTAGDRAEDVRTLRASASLLATLGVSPFMGRTFSADEDTPRGARVALVSYELWQNRFGGARDILGRVVTLDDVPYTIVGVLPPGLTMGRTTQSASAVSSPISFWVPVSYDSVDYYEATNHSYFAIGRLKPGVSLEQARADVSRILVPTDKVALDKGVRLAEWQRDQTREFKAPLYVLLAAAGLLLAIACINVATLLLGEAATREQEMAARAALGASTSRLVLQLLTESFTLALGGLVLGVALSWMGTRLLVSFAPSRIPGVADVHVDLRVLGASLAATLVTGLLFGLAPALSLSRVRPGSLFRGGGQSARGGAALQRTLIAVELALSVVLLVGAGLLTRTLQRISRVDPGFRTDHLIVDTPGFPRVAGRDTNITRAFRTDVIARLAAIPGVTAVTAADGPPFNGGSSSSTIQPEGSEPQGPGGGPRDVGPRHEVQQRVIIPGYFAAVGIPLREGRDFTAADIAGAPLVAIVSRLTARREFPNQPVLGKRVKYQREWRTIVGVVDDVHLQRLSTDVQPTIYTPVAQRRGSWVLSLFVRTVGDPSLVAPQVRKVVAEVAPAATTQTLETMTVMVNRSFAEERYRSLLVSLFGVVAAVLAAVGIYGVTSRAVSRRIRELAIRSALGATARSIAFTVIAASSVGAVVGIAVGLVGARIGGNVLTPFLFGVTATDAFTFATIFLFLSVVTLAATYLPARRASKVNIASVLRGD
ncbi:MAG TPA: ABC transporter permease [Gemmatimonadaceae bacterium]|nr:ABC transporter permease [Gemmatimonadaceae bacterium]